jgi:3-oxoacyl-[acyl-carrier protein] reductase
MSALLAGKVAIVTGAGCNIGRAEALAFARAGASVLVNDIEGADDTVAAIRAEGHVAEACDISVASWRGCEAIVGAALDAFGRLDILVNNAGILDAHSIEEMTEEAWDAVLNTNLKGCAALIRYGAPHFITQKSGIVINTGSTSGLGHTMMSNYSASKEGLLGLTRSVARDLGRHGVRCNLIRPINFITRMATAAAQEWSERSAAGGFPVNGIRHLVHYPDAVTPTGEHVAALALLLCLPETAHVSGQDFYIRGDEVGRFAEPELIRTQYKPGGWTLEALQHPQVLHNLVGDLYPRYVE